MNVIYTGDRFPPFNSEIQTLGMIGIFFLPALRANRDSLPIFFFFFPESGSTLHSSPVAIWT